MSGDFPDREELQRLKQQLEVRAEQLLVDHLGAPTAKGRRFWRWGSRGSFSYDFDRQRWHSFETEQGGDLLELFRFLHPGWDFRQAVEWARDWLGAPTTPQSRMTTAHAGRQDSATSAKLALQLWDEAKPAAGTLVETYLHQRGLVLPTGSDEVLRFHPACPRSEQRLPAMLGLMRDIRTDEPRGVHRTFLRPDGLAKAAVEPARMMLGPARGAVLKLTPDEDVTLGLALTEGIEDALALLNDGWAPVWACLSAGALASFQALGGIEVLTICSDNDSAGARAAQACAERWRETGRFAHVVAPPRRLKDFGEMAQVRAREGKHG